MPPTKKNQPVLATPLNEMLGSEGNVRILRVLCSADVPLSRAHLAAQSGLTLPGLGSALAKLHRTGAIRYVGTGSRQAVQLRDEHPLSFALRGLFIAERARREALVDELRDLVSRITPAPRSAWIVETTTAAAPVVLAVLSTARDVPHVAEQVRAGLSEAQRRFDVTIELSTQTEADLVTGSEPEAARWEGATVIYGPGPAAYLSSDAPAAQTPARRASHQDRDRESLATASWLAARLERDPTLPPRARQWLVRRMHAGTGREKHELSEWLDLLDTASVPRLQQALLDPGERGTRLRQSNPLLPVLTDDERMSLKKVGGA